MHHQGDSQQVDLIGRARALVPVLAGRAAEAERMRRIPEDVERALQDAGMFALTRPRRWGGHQADMRTYMGALVELARGDGAVAWAVSQLNNSQWIVGQLAPELREEVFAGPTSKVASVLYGQTTVERTEGGYIVDGRWQFCSGSYQADWVLAGAPIADEGAEPVFGFFVFPAREIEIEDDWQVSGFAATNSNSIVARKLFVPERRFARIDALATNAVSLAEVDTPIQRAALMPFLLVTAGVISIGMAQAMADEFLAQLPGRPIPYLNYATRGEAPVTHILLGEAMTKIQAARLLFYDAAAAVERAAERDEPMPIPQRLAARAQATYGIRLCNEAVESLLHASGGRALRLSNPLQRIDRDLRALSSHPVYTLPTAFELYGRAVLGMPPNTPFP